MSAVLIKLCKHSKHMIDETKSKELSETVTLKLEEDELLQDENYAVDYSEY